MFFTKVVGAAVGVLLGSASIASAEIQMTTTRVASGLALPLFVTAPPGDTSRLFIVEQGANGTANIKILDLQTNTVLTTPFLTLHGIDAGGERGLLGLAFHPDYAVNGNFYVYVSDTPSSNSVWGFTVSANPDVADPASFRPVMVMGDPFATHNGGWIAFGPDHYLYIASGESGIGAAQDLHSVLGKLLRIDVNGDDFPADPNQNYAIPPTNPFVGMPATPELWNLGLRNPWRDSFDRLTGDLYMGDVGQVGFEEIDFQPAGSPGGVDYGWPCMEGDTCTGIPNTGCICNAPTLTGPVSEYTHSNGCAVMGGYVYRGSALCGMQGTYFFADYCSARIWSFRHTASGITEFTERTAELHPPGSQAINAISSFGEDQNGELYICDHFDGEIYRIVPGAVVDCNHNGIEDACDISSGTSLDLDGDGIPDECQPFATHICAGDNSIRPCPCANNGTAGRGCDNSSATGGADLNWTGVPRLSADTLVLTSTGELSTAFSIVLQGDVEVTPLIFGDGLRCAAGHTKRLYSTSANAGVVSVPGIGDPTISSRSATLGDVIPIGATRLYQTYYRDPSPTFCPTPPGGTFNASSGLRVRWGL